MARTFNIGSNSSGPKDSGLAFKIMVRICGLIAIGGVFLPFIGERSGIDLFQKIQLTVGEIGFSDTMSAIFTGKTAGGTILNVFLILPYFLFPIIGLAMLIRGKYAGGPFTIILLFNIAIFVLFQIYAKDTGIDVGFFALFNIGYWVSMAGLFLPFLGMFFLDKSV